MTNGRILYHHRTQGKGVEGVHIRGMIDAFRSLDYKVDIISPLGVNPFQKKIKDPIQKNNKKILNSFWRMFSNKCPQILFEIFEILYNFYSFFKISKRLRRKKYQFIYERYALFGFACSFLSKRHRTPIILEINDATLINRSRPLMMKKIAFLIERWVSRNVFLITTITNHFKNLILTIDGIQTDKILVLPNAIDPNRFRLDPNMIITREELKIKNKYIVGAVGAFLQWHGLNFLINSIYDLLPELDIHVLLVGDGPVRPTIEALINKRGIRSYVTITGFISSDQVPYYIDLMDITLIPNSNTHCSPMKLFEYMAMGKPSIVPQYGPIEEIITDEKEGLFFPPLNRDIFRIQLRKMIKNEDMRKRIGQNAKNKVLKYHIWSNYAKIILDSIHLIDTEKEAFSQN